MNSKSSLLKIWLAIILITCLTAAAVVSIFLYKTLIYMSVCKADQNEQWIDCLRSWQELGAALLGFVTGALGLYLLYRQNRQIKHQAEAQERGTRAAQAREFLQIYDVCIAQSDSALEILRRCKSDFARLDELNKQSHADVLQTALEPLDVAYFSSDRLGRLIPHLDAAAYEALERVRSDIGERRRFLSRPDSAPDRRDLVFDVSETKNNIEAWRKHLTRLRDLAFAYLG